MNNFLFDKIFNYILLEENLPGINTDIIYNNLILGIIPIKFQIPTKNIWNLIMQYNKLNIDKIIIIISNVSKDKVINRKLSKTNLVKFSNILNQISKNNMDGISNIKKEILEKIDNLSYKELLFYCNNKIIPLLNNELQLKNQLVQYLNKLKETLFKNISLINNKEVDPNILIDIFNIYASTYNISNKLQVKISQEQTPYNDMINLIINNCNNCEIYINEDLENNNTLIDNLYKKMKQNNVKNMIIPHKINIKDINIDNELNRQNLPDKITYEDFKKIKDLLKNGR